MEKAAVLMAEGYEEGETLTIVDILRRAGIPCDTFAVGSGEEGESFVKGMHGMLIKADKEFSDEVKAYDMLVLPGGRPGGANLRENPEVIRMVKYFAAEGKYVAAMCSGTLVLADGLDRRLTDPVYVYRDPDRGVRRFHRYHGALSEAGEPGDKSRP